MVGIRRKGQYEDLKVSIPADLKREFDLLLLDPRKQEPAYGYRSMIITELLANWIAEKKAHRAQLLKGTP